ncbi:MAG: hypothetical protein MK008_10345 [Bdellovibrionales bacterium]|nr:hypothetical protein [Bdellovibrionales bacterium]
MNSFDLINLVGAWVVITNKDGTVNKGFLDRIGATQNEDSFVLADQDPNTGIVFRGRKIKITDIQSIVAGTHGDTNIS